MSTTKIIIVGAGFGGLFAARTLANKAVDVLLIDRNNYHTFTPLLYQVATCALDPSEIAYPVRSIFHKSKNIRFLLGDVIAIDQKNRNVTVQTQTGTQEKSYDRLILAAGSTPTYFGNDDFQPHSFELRTLADAVRLRSHILRRFEQATWIKEREQRQALTTIVVVGGGPTGIETAGAIYELYNHVLNQEYAQEKLTARVILIEMQSHLLAPYPDSLRHAAKTQLESLGVDVILNQAVTNVTADAVTLSDNRVIPTCTLVWAAGVRAATLADMLQTTPTRAKTIPVTPTMQMETDEAIYVIGDMAHLEDDNGQPYPMVIPVAQQQGILAANNILASLNNTPPKTFRYHDRGIMATIGRRRAVAWLFNRIPLKGFLAWLAWLGLHLITLLGFRNRLNVFINWVWNYLTYDRSVRIIWTDLPDNETGGQEA